MNIDLGSARLLQVAICSIEWYNSLNVIQVSQHHWISLAIEMSRNARNDVRISDLGSPLNYWITIPTCISHNPNEV